MDRGDKMPHVFATLIDDTVVANCPLRFVSGRTDIHLLSRDIHDVQAGPLAHELHHQPQLIFVHE